MDWDEYFLDQIEAVAKKSKDPSTKVGAIITGPDHGDRTRGFNGFPRGVEDDPELVPERYVRPIKYKWTEHAERNAIYYAARVGIPLLGCTLYVDWCPCTDCARGVIQAGISRLVIDGDSKSYNDPELQKRWKDDNDISLEMLRDAGVQVNIYHRNKK